MKKLSFIFVFGLLLNVAVAQQNNDKQLIAEFDKVMAAQFKPGTPGATALVAKNGQVIYKKAFGLANLELNVPMQPDYIFRIGSITKQFTAVAILQLMEQGKLTIQDEITRFIPDYPTQNSKITIEHLLTHTSGIQSYTGMKDFIGRMTLDLKPGELIDHFKNEPMNFAPGAKWNYNNSGYVLLGYIIEKITGKTYAQYVEENFFKPLGMTNTLYGSDAKIIKNRASGYTNGSNGYENARALSMTQPYAAGSIQSTVEDLFKWHQAVTSYKLVKKESLDKAFTKYKLADGTEVTYGYGWGLRFLQESPTIEHGGGINGFSTMSIYLPKEDVYVAVFSNCECMSPGDVTAKLAALAIGKPYEYKEIPVDNAMLQTYAGVYENDKGEQRTITVADNKLYSQRGRGAKLPVKAYEKDKFFFDDAMTTMSFSRNNKGDIETIKVYSRNGIEVWNKTNKTISTQAELKVDEKILETYVGEYEINPTFVIAVTKEKDRLFVQATGQDRFEIFAESQTKFFLKINDAKLEFVKDETGKVAKAILNQGGRTTEAKKVK
jgi:CubicO group peptidase (beta-lactamase class C family)